MSHPGIEHDSATGKLHPKNITAALKSHYVRLEINYVGKKTH